MIKTKGLFYTYNGIDYVLKNINLEISEGEILAILGENGSGKTTLIKHFNGILKPSKGIVIVNGLNTQKHSVEELSRYVGIVFQNPDHQLFAETVEKEVEFALRNFRFPDHVIKRRVNWALKLMGLDKYKDRSPFSLSIGERKRLALASVISYDPKIIILDEPTAGQDIIQKERLSELLNLFRYQGKTVIIVTHDIEFILRHVNRVIVVSNGEILLDGSLRNVITDVHKIRKANLIPPQVTETAYYLYKYGILKSYDMIYMDEFIKEILKSVKVN